MMMMMITHQMRDEPANIILFSRAEYHRSSLFWRDEYDIHPSLGGMNIIFIPPQRDEYVIHPSKILGSAERGNISTLKQNIILLLRDQNHKWS